MHALARGAPGVFLPLEGCCRIPIPGETLQKRSDGVLAHRAGSWLTMHREPGPRLIRSPDHLTARHHGGMAPQELIVLVDDEGRSIGTMPKPLVHHGETPLHRAF